MFVGPILEWSYNGEFLCAVLFDSVKERGDFVDVVGGSAYDFNLFASTKGDTHGIFMVLFQFCLDEQACGVDLAEPACGFVVSIDGGVGVVEDDYGGLWHIIKIF
jgi:hypothetical protein